MIEDTSVQEVVNAVELVASTTNQHIDFQTLLSEVSTHVGHGASFAWDTLILQFRLVGIAELLAVVATTIGAIVLCVGIAKKAKSGEEINPFTALFIATIVGLSSYVLVTYGPGALTKTVNPEYHAIAEIARLTSEYVR